MCLFATMGPGEAFSALLALPVKKAGEELIIHIPVFSPTIQYITQCCRSFKPLVSRAGSLCYGPRLMVLA